MVTKEKASKEQVDAVLKELKQQIIYMDILDMMQGNPMGEALEKYLIEHNLVLALGDY